MNPLTQTLVKTIIFLIIPGLLAFIGYKKDKSNLMAISLVVVTIIVLLSVGSLVLRIGYFTTKTGAYVTDDGQFVACEDLKVNFESVIFLVQDENVVSVSEEIYENGFSYDKRGEQFCGVAPGTTTIAEKYTYQGETRGIILYELEVDDNLGIKVTNTTKYDFSADAMDEEYNEVREKMLELGFDEEEAFKFVSLF